MKNKSLGVRINESDSARMLGVVLIVLFFGLVAGAAIATAYGLTQ